MKVKVLVILFVFLFSFPLVAEEETDFRNVRWGMSMDEIRAIEGSPVEISKDTLFYKIKVSGVELILGYEFIDGILVKAVFVNNSGYIATGNYYEDYQTIKKALTRVYGDPEKDITDWDDNNLKGLWSEKTAFELGVVSFYTEWKTDRTSIDHILMTKDIMDATHAFMYQSLVPEHQEMIQQKEQEELEGSL